jgi:hypothetical protein
VIPARPEERKERQDGEPPEPGDEGAQSTEKGGFDLNRLTVEGEDECIQPHFLGDTALLYSYDAPGSTPSRRMMVFQGAVSGHQAVVLLDLGANANFVSKGFVHRTGLPERQLATAMEVTTATGRTYSAVSQLMAVEVRVVGKHHRSLSAGIAGRGAGGLGRAEGGTTAAGASRAVMALQRATKRF